MCFLLWFYEIRTAKGLIIKCLWEAGHGVFVPFLFYFSTHQTPAIWKRMYPKLWGETMQDRVLTLQELTGTKRDGREAHGVKTPPCTHHLRLWKGAGGWLPGRWKPCVCNRCAFCLFCCLLLQTLIYFQAQALIQLTLSLQKPFDSSFLVWSKVTCGSPYP